VDIVTTTTTLDAAPLTALPTGISPLPTGTFMLPVTTPSVAPASCIVDITLSGAWSCSIQPALPYKLGISSISGTDELSNNQIMLDYGNHSVDFLVYGAQPPILTKPRVLKLVNDSQSPDRGPAWFFQMSYNKIVILPAEALLAPIVSRRNNKQTERGRPGEAPGFLGRKGVAQPGEKPWFCYWNGTMLEAFIYVNQTSRAGASSQSSSAPSQTSNPNNMASQTVSNITPSGAQSGYPPPPWGGYGGGDPQFLPLYPKVLKLEERRIPTDDRYVAPYCVQNIINQDGTYQPLLNSTGLPTTIFLNETTPLSKSMMQGKRNLFDIEEREYGLEKRSDNMCGCVWISQ